MGICYTVVCDDCKEKYDVAKYYNARLIIPKLVKLHDNHKLKIYNDEENLEEPEDYRYVEIWDENGRVKKEFLNSVDTEVWELNKTFEWIEDHSAEE